MEPSSIELKVLSCKDLKAFNFFQKLSVYALVSIGSNDPKRKLDEKQEQEQRTQTDRDGDGNSLEWNQEMRFDLGWVSFQDCDHFFLRFEFRHEGLILVRHIGEVRVPLKDLIQEAASADGEARFVNYEVRTSDGKPNGIFNFSYRIIAKGVATHSSQTLEVKITGYPTIQDHNAPDKSLIQYPTSEIQSQSRERSFPPLLLPVDCVPDGFHSPSAPQPVSSPSASEYHYYHLPPTPHYPPPPPPSSYPYAPMPYPFPPPSPVAYGPQYYRPFGPEAHGWASNPNFQHARRW